MEAGIDIKKLKRSQLYSEELGIDLSSGNDTELFKWFLASILYGKKNSEIIARHTYLSFQKHGLLSPQKIRKAGWSFLVNPVMREGGYVRYDESTASKLLRICGTLKDQYQDSLSELFRQSTNNRDLQQRLDEFYGVGPVTVNIFLRELRPYWEKCDPDPLPIVIKLAHKAGIELKKHKRKSMSFVRLEAGLIRNKKKILGMK